MQTAERRPALRCEPLEARTVPAATATVLGSTLTITGTPGNDRIRVVNEGGSLRVLDGTAELGLFPSAAVTAISIDAGGGNDSVIVANDVTQPATLVGDGG